MKHFFVLVSIVILAGCQTAKTPTVQIRDAVVAVAVADTPAERAQGLSGRNALSEGEAMWFVFDQSTQVAFWMKDMEFPIDIIWVQNGRVIGFEANVPTPTSTELLRYQPPAPITHVLEVPAGWATAHAITAGDGVQFDSR